MSERLLSTRQAADRAGVNISTMRRWAYEEQLPFTYTTDTPRQMRFDPDDVDRFVDARQQNAGEQREKPQAPQRAAPHDAGERDEESQAERSPSLLTAKEAAERAGVHVTTVNKWGRKGWVSRSERNRQQFYDSESLARFLTSRQQAPQPSGVQTEIPFDVPVTPTPTRPTRQQPPADSFATTHQGDTHQVAALKHLVAVLERELEDAKDRERRLLHIVESATVPPVRSSPAPSQQDLEALRSRPPTKWQRILEYVLNSPRPRRTWQIQRALGLEKSPHRELSRLVKDKQLIRVSDGLFARPDWQPGGTTQGQEATDDDEESSEPNASRECC